MDVCGLVETKLASSAVSFMHKFRLRNWEFLSNVSATNNARILVFWNPSTVKVELIDFTAQGLHVNISSLVNQYTFVATFVYGYNTVIARRALWDDLQKWSSNSPWIILGDFNSLLSQEDKHNGEPVSSYEVSDFRTCCSMLGLSDLNFTGCKFTWTNGKIWSKIDRVLVNPYWSSLQRSVHVHFSTPGAFSDHSPIAVRIGPLHQRNRASFKFFNMWVEHQDYKSLLLQKWHAATVHGSPMYVLCRRLKLLKAPLKQLNKLHFRHISERVCRAEAELEQHQVLLHNDKDNEHLLAQDKKLRLALVNLKSAEKMFYSQKLKCNFFKDCDRGTSFFHALMSHRHKKNFIPAIRCNSGSLTASTTEVGDVFVSYYQHLLGSSRVTLPLDETVVCCGPRLDATSQASLLAAVSNEDIKKALFSIGDHKSPGPDGYSSFFFKNSWDVVGQDLCAAVQDFFQSGQLLKQTNHSIIALVPKSAHVSTASDFRPISCCNVVYKIISKILADRLGHALDGIISPMQNAFLGGRRMADNINLLQELLRQYERKRASPRCLIKIDFRKAFDSVQWVFLRQLLLLLGFPDKFVHLVMTCVETASYSVAVNGELFGFFPGKCGVRQGDPLSPYLFITCMEYFTRMLSLVSQNPSFQFHPKCKPLGITHLSFADDVMLLCRGDRCSVQILLQQLVLFGQTSGLDINTSKSSIYFGGVAVSLKQAILLDTGFSEGSFPFRYLGVPLSPHRLLASQFSPLLHKLEAAIQAWVGKHLSYAGRLELIKSVLYGMVQFWVSIFPMPCAVIMQITCLCRNFLWTGDICRSKSALVAWKTVCLPKKEGGLGLLNIQISNNSFIAKQLWNIHQKQDSIWIRWIHHYYLHANSIWNVQIHKASSPLWKSIILLKNQLVQSYGSHLLVIDLMADWERREGGFTYNAYASLRPRNPAVPWEKIVWEPWSLPRCNFILWLAMLGKLRTRDRLRFIPTDTFCTFCSQEEESHGHLFFGCTWTSSLWNKIKAWLKLNRCMATLKSAVRGLTSRKKSLEASMRRASLSLIVYLIWEERNKRIFEGKSTLPDFVFRKFQILFFMVLHFHEKNHTHINVAW